MKPKRKCDGCGKTYVKKRLKPSKKDPKKLLCFNCRKREVTNPFYIPQKKYENKKGVGKYSMSAEEKDYMRKELMKKGMTRQEANSEIRKKEKWLLSLKKRNQQIAIQKTYAERETKQKQVQMQKRFVEGLK